MVEKFIGDKIKIYNVKYNPKAFHFDVECDLNGIRGVYPLTKKFFKDLAPVEFLDEELHIGDAVHVFLKEEKLLKDEGWKANVKELLISPDSPFKIGKKKKGYLGGAHKGIVCLDGHFDPCVLIGSFRFSPAEVKCIIPEDLLSSTPRSQIKSSIDRDAHLNGCSYLSRSSVGRPIIQMSNGHSYYADDIIRLLNQANAI